MKWFCLVSKEVENFLLMEKRDEMVSQMMTGLQVTTEPPRIACTDISRDRLQNHYVLIEAVIAQITATHLFSAKLLVS
jgi:hypothetical protein